MQDLFLIFRLKTDILVVYIYLCTYMYSINIDTLPAGHDKQAIIDWHIKNNSIAVSFCYSSNFKNTRVIRRFVEVISQKLSMWEEWVNRMILIVDELNNNAIEHGSRKTMWSEMRVVMSVDQWELDVNIEVEDSWTGMHPKTAAEMRELGQTTKQKWFKHHNSIRWRGLFLIITRLVDELYFKDSKTGGLIVWIHKKISL